MNSGENEHGNKLKWLSFRRGCLQGIPLVKHLRQDVTEANSQSTQRLPK